MTLPQYKKPALNVSPGYTAVATLLVLVEKEILTNEKIYSFIGSPLTIKHSQFGVSLEGIKSNRFRQVYVDDFTQSGSILVTFRQYGIDDQEMVPRKTVSANVILTAGLQIAGSIGDNTNLVYVTTPDNILRNDSDGIVTMIVNWFYNYSS